ncbi:MAG: hypothetical protein NTV51_23915, partial [Verrucomicrobia bacterium]|nr:hypothetical protein [Verrucomicrobiota bacterium]
QRQIERQLAPSFENLAHQVGDKMERMLYERARQLQFTAALPPFRDPSTPVAERQTVLESLHDSAPDYAWVGFADARGTVLAASQHLFVGDSATDLPWFRGARQQFYVGSVRAFPELAAAVPAVGADAPRFLEVAVPVNDGKGRFLGVIGAQLRWSWAREIQLSVVSDAARRDHLGVTLYAANGEAMLDSGGSGWTEPPEAPSGLSSRPGTRGTLTERTSGGTVYVTGYARTRGFRDYRGQGWLVVVRQPVADAFTQVQELRTRIWQLGLGLVVLLSVASWLVAARIERRLRAVALAADRIGDGDILTLMPLAHGDSALARMCGALGEMVGKFRTRQETLEAENARLAAHVKSADKR